MMTIDSERIDYFLGRGNRRFHRSSKEPADGSFRLRFGV